MSSNALESQGMTIARGDGASPESFTTIPEVRAISGPDGSANQIDTTDLSSSAKEFRMGLLGAAGAMKLIRPTCRVPPRNSAWGCGMKAASRWA